MTDKVRLLFKKEGRAVYISHLDLMRTVQRAFSRAGLMIKYSEGFNPHPQMSFALPLSVGASSECEVLDVTLSGQYEVETLPDELNRCLPEGITFLKAYFPETKAAGIKWLKIAGNLYYDKADLHCACERLKCFYESESIVVSKKTKRGVSDFDLVPAIRSIGFSVDGDCVLLEAVISAQNPTLNPSLLIEAFAANSDDYVPDFYKFRRMEIYSENMEIFR